jgi:hypothetical protein
VITKARIWAPSRRPSFRNASQTTPTHTKPHTPTLNHLHLHQTTFDSANPFILDFANFKSSRVARECYSYFCANLYSYFRVNHRLTSFFPFLYEQKNLVDIQGINSLTRPWFYVYYNYRKLAIFTFSHEYKEDHAFPDFLLAPYATITTLLRNVKLDFFTEPVEKTRQDGSKTRLEHSCTRQKSHLTSILQIQYLRSLPAICDDSKSFLAIDSTNSSSTNGCEPYIWLRITFRFATFSCSAPPPYYTTISALSEA